MREQLLAAGCGFRDRCHAQAYSARVLAASRDAQRAMGDLHGPPQARDLYGARSRACLKKADFALLVQHVRVE